MKTIAIIPARGGSKGVPGKNKMHLCGKPLISHTIECAIESARFLDIIVSSDDQEILDIADQYNSVSVHIRPSALAADDSDISDTIEAVTYGSQADSVMLLQPTAPLRRPSDIDNAINLLNCSPLANSLISVVRVSDTHPSRMYEIESTFLNPLFRNASVSSRRQELPSVYLRNGCIYLARLKAFLQHKSLFCYPILPYIMPEESHLNIDNTRDVLISEPLMRYWLQDH